MDPLSKNSTSSPNPSQSIAFMLFKILAIVTVLSLTEASSHNTTLMSGHNATTPGGHKPHELIAGCSAIPILKCTLTAQSYCETEFGVAMPGNVCLYGATSACAFSYCLRQPSVMTAEAIYSEYKLPCNDGPTDPRKVWGYDTGYPAAYSAGAAYIEGEDKKKTRVQTKKRTRKSGKVDITQACCLDDNYFGECCAIGHGMACQM